MGNEVNELEMSDNAPRTRLARWFGGAARREPVLWTAVLAIVLLMQWPMLKGMYYRTAGVPAPATSIAWRTDLDAALGEARATNKQVLVDFSADWCPPCIAMQHDVWPDPGIERAIDQGYVPLLIDIDRDDAVPARYGVEGIPTILVLDEDGRVLKRGAFLTAAGMRRFLAEP